MTNKILKYQLVSLFIIALINVYYFFFNNALPDNALLITNNSADVISISYFLSSVIAYISFYIGPWIVAPLFISAFTYTFVISKRDLGTDVIIPVSLSVFFYFAFLLAFPSLLGAGLLQVSNTLFSTYTVFGLFLFFGFLTLYFILHQNFLVTLKTFQYRLESLGLFLIKKIAHFYKKTKERSQKTKPISLPTTETKAEDNLTEVSTKVNFEQMNKKEDSSSFIDNISNPLKRSDLVGGDDIIATN